MIDYLDDNLFLIWWKFELIKIVLCYDRIDINKGIDSNETNNSREWCTTVDNFSLLLF